MILYNFGSLVAQFFNMPQAIGNTKLYSFLGMGDTLAQIFNPGDDISRSKFIKTRYADSMYNKFEIGMLKNVSNFGRWVMSGADEIATRFIWNSFYAQAKGKDIENAIGYADYQTRKMVAGRGVGEVAIMQKSRFFQMLAPFQIEVANAWYAMKDFINEKDFSGLAIFFIASWLMNNAAEKIRGNRVSFDPMNAMIEAFSGNKTLEQRLGRLAGEFLNNMPFFGQTIGSIYPEYGFQIGDHKFPTRKKLFGSSDPTRYGAGLLIVKGIRDPLFKILPPFGGLQLKRSIEGIEAAEKGVVKIGRKKVYLPDDLKTKLIAGLFGKYAVPEVKKYFKSRDN